MRGYQNRQWEGLPVFFFACTISLGARMDSTEESNENKFVSLITRLPLLWTSLAFLTGILTASRASLPVVAWLILAGIVVLLTILSKVMLPRFAPVWLGRSAQFWFLATLLLLCLTLGALRYQISSPKVDSSQISRYNDLPYDLLITGWVHSPLDVRDTHSNMQVMVTASDTGEGDKEAKGLLLVRLEGEETFKYGEVIRLRGALSTPPEGEEFSYREYLSRQGIHSYLSSVKVTRLPVPCSGNPLLRWIYDFKDKALGVIYEIFPDPEASLLAGILLGTDSGMSPQVQQAFRDTGTTHIIAISGFNITILAGFLMSISGRFLGKRRGPLVALVGISLYTILVGAEPSVVRAAIMGGLGIFARQVGRRQTALNSLAFTAAFMCLWNPFMPWDVSFQLSFAATLGLILYAQPFENWVLKLLNRITLPARAEKIASYISIYLLFTLAAQLTTLPVIAWHFGRIPLISILSNPLILPVQPAVMILGGLALLGGVIYLPLGGILAWVAWPFSAYTIHMVEIISKLPLGVIILDEFSPLFVVVFYTLLFLFSFSRGILRKNLRIITTPALLLSGLFILAAFTWRTAFTTSDGRLHLSFLDVGSAESILVETPAGRYILINGGPSPTTLSDSLGRRLPPFNHKLDWLIVGAPQEAQVAALPRVLARFPARQAMWIGNMDASYPALLVDEWLTENDIPTAHAQPGYTLDLGYGARLEVVSTTPRGGVLLIKWGDFSALLPLGLNFDALEELDYGQEIGAVDVLLLADSGYAPLNPPGWINNLKPEVIILSVSAGDRAGLPDVNVLDSCSGRNLLRTDESGWIEVTTDGFSLEVRVENK